MSRCPFDDSNDENFGYKKERTAHSPTFMQLALPFPVTIEMAEDTQLQIA